MTACLNGHDPERMSVREDGARVCLACRDMYAGRRRTHAVGRAVTPSPTSSRETRTHDDTRR